VKSASVTESDSDGDPADCREALYAPCEQLMSCVVSVRKALVKQTDHHVHRLGQVPFLGK